MLSSRPASYPMSSALSRSPAPTLLTATAPMKRHTAVPQERLSVLDSKDDGEERTDQTGLLEFLDALKQDGASFTELIYVINHWSLKGIIPLKHHGFIMTDSNGAYLSLDFGMRGLVWMRTSECPLFPEETFFARKYAVSLNPSSVAEHCEETRAFAFITNDCKTFCVGFMTENDIDVDAGEDLPVEPLPAGNNRSCVAC